MVLSLGLVLAVRVAAGAVSPERYKTMELALSLLSAKFGSKTGGAAA
jgi:hypothetical protein